MAFHSFTFGFGLCSFASAFAFPVRLGFALPSFLGLALLVHLGFWPSVVCLGLAFRWFPRLRPARSLGLSLPLVRLGLGLLLVRLGFCLPLVRLGIFFFFFFFFFFKKKKKKNGLLLVCLGLRLPLVYLGLGLPLINLALAFRFLFSLAFRSFSALDFRSFSSALACLSFAWPPSPVLIVSRHPWRLFVTYAALTGPAVSTGVGGGQPDCGHRETGCDHKSANYVTLVMR